MTRSPHILDNIYRGGSRAVDDTLHVSAMSLSGNVLGTVPVSSGSSVWELKCCIAKTILQGQMHQRRMTLMYGSHILTDATLVRDAGIATGAMLSIIRTAPYKILVGRGDIAELWNHEGRLDAVLRGHEDAITDVQFSPDTNLAITCSFDSTAKLWGVGSQECLFTLKHERMVVTGAFSTTGTTVVTTMFSHELKQWCVRSGDCISTLRLSHKGAFDFAFTAQGVHVLHTVEDCITLWNMETGTRVWDHHVGFPLWYQPHACLSRCGNWFCTLIRDVRAGPVRNTADIWNATTCSHYRGVTVPSGIVDRVEFSPDAWCLFAVCTNGNVTFGASDMIRDHALSSMTVLWSPLSSPPMDSNSLPLPSAEHGCGGLMMTRLDGAFPSGMCRLHALPQTAKGCCSLAVLGRRSGM